VESRVSSLRAGCASSGGAASDRRPAVEGRRAVPSLRRAGQDCPRGAAHPGRMPPMQGNDVGPGDAAPARDVPDRTGVRRRAVGPVFERRIGVHQLHRAGAVVRLPAMLRAAPAAALDGGGSGGGLCQARANRFAALHLGTLVQSDLLNSESHQNRQGRSGAGV